MIWGFKRIEFHINTPSDNDSFESITIRDHRDYGKVMQAYNNFRNVQSTTSAKRSEGTKRKFDDI